jgi:hypothetical protein
MGNSCTPRNGWQAAATESPDRGTRHWFATELLEVNRAPFYLHRKQTPRVRCAYPGYAGRA